MTPRPRAETSPSKPGPGQSGAKARLSNTTLLLLALIGIIAGTYAPPVCRATGVSVSPMMATLLYYLVLTLFLRRYRFLLAMAFSFVFLVFFLSFRFYGSVSVPALARTADLSTLAIYMFAYVLVPFSLLAVSVDFYSAVNYMPRYLGRGIVLPVLIKRELIRERYNTIMDALYARGAGISGVRRVLKLHLWLLPLLRTTIMEGVETYEYNAMLDADVRRFEPRGGRVSLTTVDRLCLAIAVFLLIFRIVL